MAVYVLANSDLRGRGLRSVMLFCKVPQENHMSIKDLWPCKINVLNPLLTNIEHGTIPHLLGHLIYSIGKSSYNKCCFRGGKWTCMKNALPLPLIYILGGWVIRLPSWGRTRGGYPVFRHTQQAIAMAAAGSLDPVSFGKSEENEESHLNLQQ